LIRHLNDFGKIIWSFRNKVATGSFDKTCKLWNAETGQCYFTYRGHTSEIVCLSFNPQSTIIATGSMDATTKLWDVQNGYELSTLSVISNKRFFVWHKLAYPKVLM